MRLFKGLFMLLIGMIGFTALASTPVTEQKQKIEIVKVFKAQTIVDIVLTNDLDAVTMFDKVFTVPTPIYLKFKTEPIVYSAIITDVGWKKSNFLIINKSKKMSEKQELSKGEKIIRTEFNPENVGNVNFFKSKIAELINVVEEIKDYDPRLASITITTLEEASMWAVKLATSKT